MGCFLFQYTVFRLALTSVHRRAVPEQVLQNIHEAVNDFVQDAEQFDDLTMLCLTYSGPAE